MEKVAHNIFLYQTAKGPRYMARVESGGQQIRKKGFVEQQQAADWLTTFRADLVNQQYFPERVESPLLSEIAAVWVKDCERSNLRHNTIRSYKTNLTTHVLPVLGKIPLNRITRAHIADFIKQKKRERSKNPYSRDAIRLMLAPLSCIFSEMIDEGRFFLESNPCLRPGRLIKIKVRKKPLKAYDPKQEAAILKACLTLRPDQYPLFCTLFWSGLRQGEAWALEESDLQLKAKRISVTKNFSDGELHDTPKTGQTRLVEIEDKLIRVLRQRQTYQTRKRHQHDHLVFPGQDGNHRHQSMWNRKIWTPILEKAKVPRYPPHATRHTYATRQLEQGCSLQWLMHQLGHSSIKITVDTYGHLARNKT